jgi:hypothetical protein
MKFIDAPRYVPRESYASVVGAMADYLTKQPGIASIYQIGHVSTPGISDIDMVAVFADDASCAIEPRDILSDDGRYLFIHNLYGVSRSDFLVGQSYSFFHNYVHLWGEEIPQASCRLTPEEESFLKRQLALEYLVKMYIGMTVEQTYKIIKLRSLMLQVKGLLYDCDFLGITSGPFVDAIKHVVGTREKWFASQPRFEEIRIQCARLYEELARFLDCTLQTNTLFLPPMPPYRLSKNIRVHSGAKVQYRHLGFNMPSSLGFSGRKYFNLQHRFNRFDFEVPLESNSIPQVIQRQFDWQRGMQQNNRNRFPHFMALSSSLNLS